MSAKSAAGRLEELRWNADQVITNAFGDRAWLKQTEGGLTECCHPSEPCAHHTQVDISNIASLIYPDWSSLDEKEPIDADMKRDVLEAAKRIFGAGYRHS